MFIGVLVQEEQVKETEKRKETKEKSGRRKRVKENREEREEEENLLIFTTVSNLVDTNLMLVKKGHHRKIQKQCFLRSHSQDGL